MTLSDVGAQARRLGATSRGVIALFAAMALFVGNDTIVKLVSVRLPASEVMVLRGLAAVLFTMMFVARSAGLRQIGHVLDRTVLLRALCEAAVAFTYISAIAFLPLGEIVAITQLAPVLITLLAVLFLGETVRWRRWTAILAGFAGVLLVVRPSPQGVDPAVLLALAATLGVAVRDLITRRVPTAVPSAVVSLCATVSVVLVGAALSTAQTWIWPSVFEIQILLFGALLLAAGNWLVVIAFRGGGDISVISPVRYSVILWALLFGYLVWGEVPDLVALLGTVIIVVAGLYNLHRDSVRRRAALAAGGPDE